MSDKAQRVHYIIQLITVVVIVAALINLGVELRHVRRAIESHTVQDIRKTYAQHFAHVTQSPDLAGILMRLAKDTDGVEADVKMRFYATLFFVFTSHENAYHQKTDGILELREWHLFNSGMTDLMSLPGVQTFWQKRKHWYSEDFRDYIENEVIPKAASINYEPIA